MGNVTRMPASLSVSEEKRDGASCNNDTLTRSCWGTCSQDANTFIRFLLTGSVLVKDPVRILSAPPRASHKLRGNNGAFQPHRGALVADVKRHFFP